MLRSPSRRSLAAWLGGGLLVWSCSPEPGSRAKDGRSGSTAAGTAGSSSVGGSASNSEAGSGPSGATAGAGSVGSGNGGSPASELGGASAAGTASNSEGGADDSSAAGAAEGGAGGSDDSGTIFEGKCVRGWAAPESPALPKLQGDVKPLLDSSGNWSFAFGRYRFVVAAAHGARVIEFSLDGVNLIDAGEGSTFWPSPQQAYTWPPPAELDSAAYVAEADATALTVTSKTSTALELSVRKRFWVNATSGVVSIEYQLINQSAASAPWAPWEVTRVRAGGFTFAPKGPGNRTITQDTFQQPLPMSLLPPAPAMNRVEWLNYPSLSLTQDNYISEFDGAEGWLAHANRFGTKLLPVLFVKSFVDAPDERLPSNQAEIQLWTSGTTNPKLLEIEQQGAEELLLPGAALSWTVHWSACELPSSAVLAAGNSELTAFARARAIGP